MSEAFDPSRYVTAPVLGAASGVALGVSLLTHAPRGLSGSARDAARALRAATQRVQGMWAKQRPRAKPDSRPFDNAADVSWGALAGRLAALASLPADLYPAAAEAAAALDALELNDLSWLKLRHNEQWAQAQRRLEAMAAGGLRGRVASLAGEVFVAEVERAHAAYGEVLGITAAHEAADDNVALQEPLRELAEAIAEYGLQLAALHRGADAEMKRAVRDALAPIDAHRARYARGRAAPEEGVTPVTPVPDPG